MGFHQVAEIGLKKGSHRSSLRSPEHHGTSTRPALELLRYQTVVLPSNIQLQCPRLVHRRVRSRCDTPDGRYDVPPFFVPIQYKFSVTTSETSDALRTELLNRPFKCRCTDASTWGARREQQRVSAFPIYLRGTAFT